MSKLIALCIGHSRFVNGQRDGGAVAVDHQTSEWQFNSELAAIISSDLGQAGITATTISRYYGNGYVAAQSWLAGELKRLGASAALELHFNDSDDERANGHEVLYWRLSARGKALASMIDHHLDTEIPEIRHRDVVPIGGGDRGAQFLYGTPCPAVIVESFFGSNPSDFGYAYAHKEYLARAISLGISDWVSG